MAPIQKFCLSPLTRDFKNRLAARGPLTMKWTCENLSARVVSHRAAPLGDDQPDTAYRQVVSHHLRRWLGFSLLLLFFRFQREETKVGA
jgi:hypothetical protein